ncbi:MAG: Crp/Fnr family transcriptional regulator [Deltaproteobacteria bacterium]|nr:Crp/Fnr family transcriptional regulator [Deltaproteobacteria bacterium]
MKGSYIPRDNRILAGLSVEEYESLLPYLEHVSLHLGQLIHAADERPTYIYFPISCVISSLYTTMEGATAEMGLAGRDGALGIALFLGGNTMPCRAVVVIAGEAFRMKNEILQQTFARGGSFQRRLLLYTQAYITQISQTAACNRLHSLDRRLARWLLLCHDRVNSTELLMTQEFIAGMLGGRRESVTIAAGRLQDAHLIHYARGRIKIVDRQGLEAVTCECYRIVRQEEDRLFDNR